MGVILHPPPPGVNFYLLRVKYERMLASGAIVEHGEAELRDETPTER